jgi:hypothetical protein
MSQPLEQYHVAEAFALMTGDRDIAACLPYSEGIR